MEAKEELLISIKSIISTYALMNNLKSITNEAQLNEVKKLIRIRHLKDFNEEIIEETILKALEEEYDVLTKKMIGYPYLAAKHTDNNELLQIVWILNEKTAIMLYNADTSSKNKFGTIVPSLNESLYRPYNKIFIMCNEGVVIPSFIREYIQQQ